MKKAVLFLSLVTSLIMSTSAVWAHEPVKLSGYAVDVLCAAEHLKENPVDAMKFAAEHTKECGLMDECIKSGYGLFSDGVWYPFNEKGTALAKMIFDNTQKIDQIKVTVIGKKHGGTILVDKITEE